MIKKPPPLIATSVSKPDSERFEQEVNKYLNAAVNEAGSSGIKELAESNRMVGLVKSGSTETLTNNGTGFNGCGTAVRNGVTNQSDIVSNGNSEIIFFKTDYDGNIMSD